MTGKWGQIRGKSDLIRVSKGFELTGGERIKGATRENLNSSLTT